MSTDPDISMNEISEAFTIFYSRLIEVQRSLNHFDERFSLSFDHNNTLTIASNYVIKEATADIHEILNAYVKQSKYFENYFAITLSLVSQFIDDLQVNDVKIDDREDMINGINEQIQALDDIIDEIDEITASDAIKIMEKERRDIEMNLHIMATLFQRHENDEIRKKLVANMYIDLAFEIVMDAKEYFNDSDGPIQRLKMSMLEMEGHYENLAVVMMMATNEFILKEN